MTLLPPELKKQFDEKVYSYDVDYFDGDCADYDVIKTPYQGNNIVVCGWLSPHEDIECGHEDIYTFQVLDVDSDLDDEESVCFVYTRPDGGISGVEIQVGSMYSFCYKKTHALLPKYLAQKVFENQSFDIEDIKDFKSKRETKGYSEKAKMAFYFLDVKGNEFSL